jgi:hypothetical protein
MVRDVPRNLAAMARLATGHSHLHDRFENGLAEIRHNSRLPALQGTVDAYPCNAAVAIAYGLDYQPRPIMQSYVAYTPELAQLNADHLHGPNAPDNILFVVLNDPYWLRHVPSSDDSLSWPLLLSQYDVTNKAGGFLILHKAAHPRGYELVPISQLATGFGATVSVPAPMDGPVWVRITIHASGAGKLLSLLYKDPELNMTLLTRDGREHWFRLVPGEAEAGFLLSPLIEGNSEFASLAAGDATKQLAGKEVRTITFSQVGWVGKRWAYQPEITVEFARLVFSPKPGGAGVSQRIEEVHR